jgi:uncharacterized membrane protein YesL
VFGTVYTGLMVNVFLAVACAPLLAALALVGDPPAAWPFFVALSCLCAPALAGAFACFARIGDEDERPIVFRPFWAAYRRCFARSVATWATGAAAVSVLVLDAIVVAESPFGVVLVPFFAVACALVMAVTLAIVVALADDPSRRVRSLMRPAVYLVARKCYVALPGLLVLGLAGGAVLKEPVIGLMLACSPLLYVAWAHFRSVVAPLIVPSAGETR